MYQQPRGNITDQEMLDRAKQQAEKEPKTDSFEMKRTEQITLLDVAISLQLLVIRAWGKLHLQKTGFVKFF